MRGSFNKLIAGLVLGCVPQGGETTSSTTTVEATTTATATIGGSETGAGTPTTGTTGGATGGTTGGGTTGDATTGAPTTGDLDTTTGAETLCDSGKPGISARLEHIDGPDVPDCGTIELQPRLVGSPGPGVFELDACPCGIPCESPDPWLLTVEAPAQALPQELPACSWMVLERQWNAEHTACEFAALSVWDPTMASLFGRYHAAARLEPTAKAVDAGWLVTSSVNEACPCDECCSPPALFDLTFAFSEISPVAQLAEGHETLGSVAGMEFRLVNLRSHDAGQCEPAAFGWAIRAEGP